MADILIRDSPEIIYSTTEPQDPELWAVEQIEQIAHNRGWWNCVIKVTGNHITVTMQDHQIEYTYNQSGDITKISNKERISNMENDKNRDTDIDKLIKVLSRIEKDLSRISFTLKNLDENGIDTFEQNPVQVNY